MLSLTSSTCRVTETEGNPPSLPIRLLSLGAGVPSTTLMLMAAHGEIGPMPDCAIFADTGSEPKAVYAHLEWLRSPNVLPVLIYIVSTGNIRDNLIEAAAGRRWASIPSFAKTVTPAGTEVPVLDEDKDSELVEIATRRTWTEIISIGMIRRACTTDYKIVPIRRKVRELLGLTRKRSPAILVAEQWIGISLEEASRIKPNFEDWQVNRWPLIEKRMTRRDCLAWLLRHDYPEPPKSACIGCPFHDDARSRFMRDHDPAAWAYAVDIDDTLRTGLRGIRGAIYLHRSCIPLSQVDLSTAGDRGQLDLWPNECEGMCGV